MQRIALALVLVFAPAAAPQTTATKPREVRVQRSSMARDAEVRLGQRAAAQVEKSVEVVHNAEVEAWLNRIGRRLAATREANDYPYYFKLVNDESMNAFALPGGPMYVNTGLVMAAESESQVAGVLAHEMSHVALRHGVAQMSKAQTWQTVLGLAGAVAGGGIAGQAVQVGGGVGISSLLSKFSRDYERDADLNGARMAAAAGYNPLDLASFFEQLEAQMGSAAKPRGLEAWMASHPAPGRRRTYIQEDVQFYPRRQYASSSSDFGRIQKIVKSIPPPEKPAQSATEPAGSRTRR